MTRQMNQLVRFKFVIVKFVNASVCNFAQMKILFIYKFEILTYKVFNECAYYLHENYL